MTSAPRILFLVSSHTTPEQVLRLAGRLLRRDVQAQVLIHHDASSPYRLEASDVAGLARCIVYPKPVAIEWGSFSIVESFLIATQWALDNLDFDWLYWISGQDYPIKGSDKIAEDLCRSSYDGYVESFDICSRSKWPPEEGVDRYYFQYHRLPRFSRYYIFPDSVKMRISQLRRWANAHTGLRIKGGYRKSSTYLGIRAHHPPFRDDFRCYGGSQWLTLRRPCLSYVHDFVAHSPDVVRYYKRTLIPDESFLVTILKNCQDLRLADHNLSFAHWATERDSSPTVLTIADLDRLLSSGAHFARKFDIRVDAAILDALDRVLGYEEER